ncbi:L-xylulose reductase-like [Hydractinia symbiolongicarpus]|uniref:L-xylulose reductase-like n=1 Tax=Hydractinia symbiolongicarpus TaxID=13093 RepID=UPI002550B8B7|nr:L-xylulose reductase-like [Hydractinia symbiolongicarpus]
MNIDFNGKKVLVTGAGKGIGRSLCVALCEGNADVYALSRTQSDLDNLQKECPNIHCILADLQNFADVREKLSELPNDITLLVNNAGYAKLEHFLDVTEEAFDTIMNINVKAMLIVSQIMAKKMISNKCGGSIVNVSSQASMTALPLHTAYCTSKGAVDQLTRMMALELGPHRIRVNAVNPTVVLTDMGKLAWSDPKTGDPMKKQIPQGKFAEVKDVVHPILYLLSEKSDMINGVMLPVDGGFLATKTLK